MVQPPESRCRCCMCVCVWRAGGSAKGAHKDVICVAGQERKVDCRRGPPHCHSALRIQQPHTHGCFVEGTCSHLLTSCLLATAATATRQSMGDHCATNPWQNRWELLQWRMFDVTQTHSTTTPTWTDNAIKNRFYSTMRRIMRKSQQATGEY